MLKKLNDKYMIDEYGAVFNTYTNKYLKQYDNGFGYKYVMLTLNGKYKQYKVHRLVAEHFIKNVNNYPCVNHIDSNRKNNDVSNLEFCTHKQNTQWALKTGRFDNMKKLNSQRMKENRVWENRWNNA